MATFLSLAQLLFLGTVVVSAQTEAELCDQLLNVTEGNFSLQVTPKVYQENTTYLVTIEENNSNSTDNSSAQYFLQVLSPKNESLGEWLGVPTANCSSLDTAILNSTQNAANWTSPGRNVSSVQIRAYISSPGKPAAFRMETLSRAPTPTTTPRTTPNSVPAVWSSSFFLTMLQLPLLLATGTLLS